MRFRLGFVSGFASGYYLGAKAGRQRYEQINEMFRRVRGSESFETVTSTAKEVLDRDADSSDSSGGGSPNGAPTKQAASTDSPAASFAPYAVDSPTEES